MVPLSDWTSFGRPKVVKNFRSTALMALVRIFLNGNASGYLVLAHMSVSRYWFPPLVFGSGPTQSIMTRENGSPKAGMGFNGADGGSDWCLPAI